MYRVQCITAGALLGATILAGAASPAAAAVAISGAVGMATDAEVEDIRDIHHDQDSWSHTPRDMSATAKSSAGKATRAYTVSAVAEGTVRAHWDSANSGTVEARDFLVTHRALGAVPNTSTFLTWINDLQNQPANIVPAWSYTFTAEGDGTFSLDYDTIIQRQALGMAIWGFAFGEVGGFVDTDILPAPNYTDTDFDPAPFHNGVTRKLVGGKTYTVTLIAEQGTGGVNSVPGNGGLENTRFHWSINDPKAVSGVPEPSVWAMTIAGFGLCGAMLRRRSRALQAA